MGDIEKLLEEYEYEHDCDIITDDYNDNKSISSDIKSIAPPVIRYWLMIGFVFFLIIEFGIICTADGSTQSLLDTRSGVYECMACHSIIEDILGTTPTIEALYDSCVENRTLIENYAVPLIEY